MKSSAMNENIYVPVHSLVFSISFDVRIENLDKIWKSQLKYDIGKNIMLITVEPIVRTVIDLVTWKKGQREAIKKTI